MPLSQQTRHAGRGARRTRSAHAAKPHLRRHAARRGEVDDERDLALVLVQLDVLAVDRLLFWFGLCLVLVW